MHSKIRPVLKILIHFIIPIHINYDRETYHIYSLQILVTHCEYILFHESD